MENQKFNPVVWFEIYVDDMERATKFYETVLNIKLEQMSDPSDESMQMKAFPGDMKNHGTSGTLVKMEGGKVGGTDVIIYFGCEDCAVEESRVKAVGGKICKPKMPIGEYGFCSIVTDTEGNTIGLHSMK
ncbi:VOC family protein [Niabella ginsengisoli]|uniref:VOC family protein n=1 Tax=Niabella ginsengisoli TaxID=522298 RepID=A0ABS9SED2_9BACT|nr:VOC family protein [Niabella ginsengisoli]MCH5596714.1 VOC family protein [Niabella ginsengisoli]